MREFWLAPLEDLMAALKKLLYQDRIAWPIGQFILALIVAWFVYVPLHELLHVLGCVATGGSVSELQIAPEYGGTLLARIFPFVVSGGDYAGRLSGFDWKGSDLIYLATDIAPFLLTVFLGVPLLIASTVRARPVLFGAGVVVGLAPFMSLSGDYFEMGSIVVTRVASLVAAADLSLYLPLRSDDVFKLLQGLFADSTVGWDVLAVPQPVALLIVLFSFLLGLALAFGTYALGRAFAGIFK